MPLAKNYTSLHFIRVVALLVFAVAACTCADSDEYMMTYNRNAKRLFEHLRPVDAKGEWHREHEEFLKLGQQIIPILIDFVQLDDGGRLKKLDIDVHESNPNQLRGGAIKMLGELRADGTFDLIVKELKKENDLLGHCIYALSCFKGNKNAFRLILPYLKFQKSDLRVWPPQLAQGIREQTAASLGRFGDTEAIPYLEEFIRSERDEYMKERGRRAIVQIQVENKMIEK